MKNYIDHVSSEIIRLVKQDIKFNMENLYEIGVANRYALFLDEDEDPYEVLKVHEQVREAKKKTKLSEKENKGKLENKGKVVQGPRKGIKETQNTNTLDSGKTREENVKTISVPRSASEKCEKTVRFADEAHEERINRRIKEDKIFLGAGEFTTELRENNRSEVEYRGQNSGLNRGSRGLGRGRIFRRDGYENRNKREFDRQSGSDKTGIKSVEKRDGAGAHNWGTYKDDMEEQLHAPRIVDQQVDLSEKIENEGANLPEISEVKDSEDTEDETTQGVEEEPRVLTLDEYYATRRVRQKPIFNTRKAGEGEDLTQWKNMYELKKKDGEEEEDEDEYDSTEYPQRAGRQKYLLDINIHFADSRRGGRGVWRGGLRGTGRGRGMGGMGGGISPGPGDTRPPFSSRGFIDRSRREPFQRTQRQDAPKVDDENDFPSLS